MSRVDFGRPGVWAPLFERALELMAHLERVTDAPPWSFGGGTVLMLRHGHRISKDIDLFVPDPQYLGYVNPRLSDAAEAVSQDYEENAEFIKLFLPQGEIDVVVGTPLTTAPFEIVRYRGRDIRVETSAEILAKKMWHRGNQAKARDLFDLCAVHAYEPAALAMAAPWMRRHGRTFLERLTAYPDVHRRDFEAIEAVGFTESFGTCLRTAHAVLAPLLGPKN